MPAITERTAPAEMTLISAAVAEVASAMEPATIVRAMARFIETSPNLFWIFR
jgi:hypothetical protein